MEQKPDTALLNIPGCAFRPQPVNFIVKSELRDSDLTKGTLIPRIRRLQETVLRHPHLSTRSQEETTERTAEPCKNIHSESNTRRRNRSSQTTEKANAKVLKPHQPKSAKVVQRQAKSQRQKSGRRKKSIRELPGKLPRQTKVRLEEQGQGHSKEKRQTVAVTERHQQQLPTSRRDNSSEDTDDPREKTFAESNKQNRGRRRQCKKLHRCKFCLEIFTTSCLRRQHMRTHAGESEFRCRVCQRLFKSSDTLQGHLRVHTGESLARRSRHPCEVCGKTFRTPFELKRHDTVHSGLKPFSCDVCGKAFTQAAHLDTHLSLHTGENLFKARNPCTVCRKTFGKPSDLQAHLRIHTGERPYTCNACERRFTQASQLRAHMKRNDH